MSGRINTNIGAFEALNALNSTSKALSVSQLKLATGKRINSVGDDPSGYTIAKQMEARSRQMSAALNNVGDAKSLVSTSEQAMQTARQLLTTIQEKFVAAQNPSANVTAITNDINQMVNEISDILVNTKFNSSAILGGTSTSGASFTGTFQVGVGSTETLQLSWNTAGVSLGTIATSALSVAGFNDTTLANAISAAETALQSMGSFLQRLDAKEGNLNTAIVNIEASKSRIMDADIAKEQVNATKLNILQQTSVAMLSQANQAPQAYLSLFR